MHNLLNFGFGVIAIAIAIMMIIALISAILESIG